AGRGPGVHLQQRRAERHVRGLDHLTGGKQVRPGDGDRTDDEYPVAEQRPADPGHDRKSGQREERGPPAGPRPPPACARGTEPARTGVASAVGAGLGGARGGGGRRAGHGRPGPDEPGSGGGSAIAASTSGPIVVMSPAPIVSTRSPGAASAATTLGT